MSLVWPTASLKIRAIEVTDNASGDAPMLPCLRDQIPADETVANVGVDGAYDTKGCHKAIAQRGRRRLSLLARTPSHRKTSALVSQPAILAATRRLAGKSGRSGAPITGAALSRPRCDAPSYLVNASWRVTSTAKSPNCGSALLSSIGSPGWASPRVWR